jgi:hypothetical protein
LLRGCAGCARSNELIALLGPGGTATGINPNGSCLAVVKPTAYDGGVPISRYPIGDTLIGTSAETLTLFDGASTPNYFTNVRIAVKFKMAISVEALTCKASFNGSAISTANHNGNLLNSVTLLGFFETASGFITGVKYYRKNLSNAKLQSLTV